MADCGYVLLALVVLQGEWRRLHNKELCDLLSSSNVILVIKSRRTRWAGHVIRMGDMRCTYRVFVGKPER
jgi:hypothetical protein